MIKKMQNSHPKAFTIGLALVCNTVLFWGVLPIALIFSLKQQDSVTVTWFRFLVAAIAVGGIQLARGKLKEFNSLTGQEWGLLVLAALFLIGDYVLFIYGLTLIEPSAMTVFSQTTPLFLALSGVLFFGERINWLQAASGIVLFIGLGLFFNGSIMDMAFGRQGFMAGALIAVFASFIWVLYASLQKKLVTRLSSPNILLFIYLFASVVLMPFSDLNSFSRLDNNAWAILGFCAVNTLVAYTTFSESMKYWPSTHISSLVAITPLITILASFLANRLWPDVVGFTAPNLLGWAGAALVLAAALAFNLKPRKRSLIRKTA